MPDLDDLPRPSSVQDLFQDHRFLADGVPFEDVQDAHRAVAEIADWLPFWEARADEYERLGRDALAAGARLSAGRWLWLASLCAHYAQYLWIFEPERREAGQRRKVALYRQAAPLLSPAAERIEIPFSPIDIPAYLRLPPDTRPAAGWPCALLIGGGESTKEESLLFEQMLLERGVATLAFDGPGQGEVFFSVKAGPGFEAWTSRVVDYAQDALGQIDRDRIGVLGRSLGGHYALRSFATDPRLKACVGWGAFWDGGYVAEVAPFLQYSDLYVAGFEWSEREAGIAYLRESWDLSDVAGPTGRPLLVIQGGRDVFWDHTHLDRIRERFGDSQAEFETFPDGNHCCHNLAAKVRPRLADWLAAAL